MYGNPIYGNQQIAARAWAASAVSLRNALGSGNALIVVALEPEIPRNTTKRNTTTKHSTGHKNLKSFGTSRDFRGLGWVRFMLLKSGPAMLQNLKRDLNSLNSESLMRMHQFLSWISSFSLTKTDSASDMTTFQ